jgi:Acetyltransferase (GNAT) domain
MRFYQIDPTQDARWTEFIGKHPNASVFHTVGWLNALRWTYGFEPVAFTTSPPTGELKNALVFCRVQSWLTGDRLVSLPFSDHCEPLCDSVEDLNFLLRYLQAVTQRRECNYMEIRPLGVDFSQTGDGVEFGPAATHSLRVLDLRSNLNEIFRNLDKDCVQRRVGRAAQGGLTEKCGRSDDLIKDFYALFLTTRLRNHLPPIPYAWFRNLVKHQREALEIHLAYQGKTPVAAILTLRFRSTVYLRHGCSDAKFDELCGMPWLLANVIAAAKSNGALQFDMGPNEEGHTGLLALESHSGSHLQKVIYWKFPDSSSPISEDGWKLRIAKRAFSYMPDRLLSITGNLLYRHIG